MSFNGFLKFALSVIALTIAAASLNNTATAQIRYDGADPVRCPESFDSLDSDFMALSDANIQWHETAYPMRDDGERDCWYYAFSDRKGGLSIPFDWGNARTFGERYNAYGVVRVAHEALDAALNEYTGIDGPLEIPVFVSFLNNDNNTVEFDEDALMPEAFQAGASTEEDACTILVKHPENWSSWRRTDLDPMDYLRWVLSHELAHCYLDQRTWAITSAHGRSSSFRSSWEEAAASWMAGMAYPNNVLLTVQARTYDFEEPHFLQAYASWFVFDAIESQTDPDTGYRRPVYTNFWNAVLQLARVNSRDEASRVFRPYTDDLHNALRYLAFGQFYPSIICENARLRGSDCAISFDVVEVLNATELITPRPSNPLDFGRLESLDYLSIPPGQLFLAELDIHEDVQLYIRTYPANVTHLERFPWTPQGAPNIFARERLPDGGIQNRARSNVLSGACTSIPNGKLYVSIFQLAGRNLSVSIPFINTSVPEFQDWRNTTANMARGDGPGELPFDKVQSTRNFAGCPDHHPFQLPVPQIR